MGLHLCYALSLPADRSEHDVRARLTALRQHAASLPFSHTSPVVPFTEVELAGPWPARGLALNRIEDAVHVSAVGMRQELYARREGVWSEEFVTIHVPPDVRTVVWGFGIAVGRGCEPATFYLARLRSENDTDGTPWRGRCCCKTQYASVVSDEHLVRCHGSLVALLDAAVGLGFGVDVHDETGYWDSRDERQLCEAVAGMNRIVARIAGAITDAARASGRDSREVQGAIFEHPDFERLETTPWAGPP